MGNRIKITQPNLMILVSLSFAEDALSNDVKNNIKFLARKVLKGICRSAIFLDTIQSIYNLQAHHKGRQ